MNEHTIKAIEHQIEAEKTRLQDIATLKVEVNDEISRVYSEAVEGLVGKFEKDAIAAVFGGDPIERRVLLLGLDSAGKTTMLYKLKLGEIVHCIPTIGFNTEFVDHDNVKFVFWDVGGQERIRQLWQHYYENTHAVVFVVDSNDRHRIPEVREALHKLLVNDDLAGRPLLVFANKQDLPNAMSTPEVVDKLNLHTVRNRKWYI